MDIQLGRSKTVRRAYGIDEIALVPGGRTVDPELGIHCAPSWHKRDLINSVGAANSFGASKLNVHRATFREVDSNYQLGWIGLWLTPHNFVPGGSHRIDHLLAIATPNEIAAGVIQQPDQTSEF